MPLGIYRGLRFGMVLHPQWTPEVYLEGAIMRKDTLSREHQGPRAVLNAVERLARGYGVECERTRQDLGDRRGPAPRLPGPARAAVPARRPTWTELAALRDQLKAGLSGAVPEPAGSRGRHAAELAEQIKALKAANTVEATPERTGKRRSTAEEPVTARIHRRLLPTPDGEGSGSGS